VPGAQRRAALVSARRPAAGAEADQQGVDVQGVGHAPVCDSLPARPRGRPRRPAPGILPAGPRRDAHGPPGGSAGALALANSPAAPTARRRVRPTRSHGTPALPLALTSRWPRPAREREQVLGEFAAVVEPEHVQSTLLPVFIDLTQDGAPPPMAGWLAGWLGGAAAHSGGRAHNRASWRGAVGLGGGTRTVNGRVGALSRGACRCWHGGSHPQHASRSAPACRANADQDSVRLIAVEACTPLAKVLPSQEVADQILPIMRQFAQARHALLRATGSCRLPAWP
jgi:hypothetical protein